MEKSKINYKIENKYKMSSKIFWLNMLGLVVAFVVMPVATIGIYRLWGNPTWMTAVAIVASLTGIVSVVQCNLRDWKFAITGFIATVGWLIIGIYGYLFWGSSLFGLIILQISTLVIASWQTINWYLKKVGFKAQDFQKERNKFVAGIAIFVLFSITLFLNTWNNDWQFSATSYFDALGVGLYKTGAWLMVFGNIWSYFFFVISDLILSANSIFVGVTEGSGTEVLWGVALLFYAYLGLVGYLGAKESKNWDKEILKNDQPKSSSLSLESIRNNYKTAEYKTLTTYETYLKNKKTSEFTPLDDELYKKSIHVDHHYSTVPTVYNNQTKKTTKTKKK